MISERSIKKRAVKKLINCQSFLAILFVCIQLHSGVLCATPQVIDDTTSIEQKSFDRTQVRAFKENADFQYESTPSPTGLSLWDRLKLLIGLWLAKLLSFGGNSSFGRALVYILCLSVITYVILKLLKIDIRHVFYRSHKSGALQYRAIHDDIHVMDFDVLIKDAVDKTNFREAVRLIYLAALKKLSDSDHLQWQVGKTNHDYMAELSGTTLQQEFDQLSYYFDYSWYGQFLVDQQLYQEVSEKYNSLTQKIIQ